MNRKGLELSLLALFVLSGFAGLIYQSVWSHYLGLTLGHAAYAQTLVLAIYMGGMALGAWWASKRSLRWHRLILGYAVVEGLIGALGLVFHPLFVAYTGWSQDAVLPALGNATLAHAYQWLTAAALITPQSILLGATFPLMSAGLIRVLPQSDGQVLGGLYFTNSLGAACGALAATFLLLPAVGLPGTVMAAGLLNVLVALLAWAVSKRLEGAESPAPQTVTASAAVSKADSTVDLQRLTRTMLAATAISGAASFVYEIGWVRLLNQAFGTTVHSFELMLAAFIFGLAFGGLWVRRRSAMLADPVRYVGIVQVLMGVAALLSIPVFTQSFDWVSWIMGALSRTGNGYTLFELATAAIALLVMFPAAFFAGMTLPLFTMALLRAGADERAIGRIYAANTLGAIAGVAIAVHVLIPVVGVRLAVSFAALVDGLLGLYLLRVLSPGRFNPTVAAAALSLSVVAAFSMIAGRPDPAAQISGVFRTGEARNESAVVEYLRDGKTATTGVFRLPEGTRVIATNGKPDAGLTPLNQAPTPDEATMIMAGVLPLVLHPRPEQIAVIGWGSGLSTHTVLGGTAPRQVDTIEIESAMVEGARLFGERVSRAYEDPRSTVHIDDARTFFSTGARSYDVVVSEPSNPWVSGVASLFTREFYAFVKRHLKDGGMLVQWLHSYELDDPLVATMLSAVIDEFAEVDVYVTNSVDLLLVASARPMNDIPEGDLAASDSILRHELQRVGMETGDHLRLRRIGGRNLLETWIRLIGVHSHSDYFPTVSLRAPKTRFMNSRSDFLTSLVGNGMPVLDVLECRQPLPLSKGLVNVQHSLFSSRRAMAAALVDAVAAQRQFDELDQRTPGGIELAQAAIIQSRLPLASEQAFRRWSRTMATLSANTIGHLAAEDLASLWIDPSWVVPELRQRGDVSDILSAYRAAALRDVTSMRQTAERVLAQEELAIGPEMREQMLVLAMLGALGDGDPQSVARIDETWGKGLPSSRELGPIRAFLRAWADGPVPACMASASRPH